MFEEMITTGVTAALIPIVVYNARRLSKIEQKVDLIYDNINIRMSWGCKASEEEEKHGVKNK